VSFVISTEPGLSDYHQRVFHVWEGVTSTIFLVEYITRLVVVCEARKYYERGPFWGRVSYALTSSALIDFLATIPFFMELTTGWDLPTLTYLRAFRLLRILKTSGFSEATRAVYRVVYYNRQILYVALLICVGLVLLTSVLMYYLRPQDPDHSQDFQSLGATMYLSTLMLTGQGGPDGEMPWYTKGVVLLTGIFSIGMFAIPASMLTWGFEAEAERMAQLAYAKQRKPGTVAEHDNWSFSSDDYSTGEVLKPNFIDR
jgi:voltage-gated potassium channel